MEPTYLLWMPRALPAPSGETIIRFNATPLAALEWPAAGVSFYTQLLGDMGISTPASTWEVLAYRSRYHGDPAAADWRDRWKRNWRITITTRLGATVPRFEEGYEATAFSVALPVQEGPGWRAFLLADFVRRDAARQTEASIRSAYPHVHGFETLSVEESFWQLQVDLGMQSEAFFREDSSHYRTIEEQCRQYGGWPTFQERIEHLG